MEISIEDLVLRFRTYFEKEYGSQVHEGELYILASFYHALINEDGVRQKKVIVIGNETWKRFRVYFIKDGGFLPLILPPYLREKYMKRYGKMRWHFFSNAIGMDRIHDATGDFIRELHTASRLECHWIQVTNSHAIHV